MALPKPKANQATANIVLKYLTKTKAVISKWGVEALIPDRYEGWLQFAIDFVKLVKPKLPK